MDAVDKAADFMMTNSYYKGVGKAGPFKTTFKDKASSALSTALSLADDQPRISKNDVKRAYNNLILGGGAIALTLAGLLIPLKGSGTDLAKVMRALGGIGIGGAVVFNVAPAAGVLVANQFQK